MGLSNNYTFDDRASGYPLRFVYLAYDGRLQAYLGRTNHLTGEFEPESVYLDETTITAETRADLRARAFDFTQSADEPDDMTFRPKEEA